MSPTCFTVDGLLIITATEDRLGHWVSSDALGSGVSYLGPRPIAVQQTHMLDLVDQGVVQDSYEVAYETVPWNGDHGLVALGEQDAPPTGGE